jgi:hypothetical protein
MAWAAGDLDVPIPALRDALALLIADLDPLVLPFAMR